LLVFSQIHENADATHLLRLLCARTKRPGSHCTAEKRYELAPSHCLSYRSGQDIVPAQSWVGKGLSLAVQLEGPLQVTVYGLLKGDTQLLEGDTQGIAVIFQSTGPFFNGRRNQLIGLAALHAIPASYVFSGVESLAPSDKKSLRSKPETNRKSMRPFVNHARLSRLVSQLSRHHHRARIHLGQFNILRAIADSGANF
jgi:hypothetical protein